MQITTAKVQYQEYVHLGKFFDVNFYGFRAKEMEEKWSEIKDEQHKNLILIYDASETTRRSKLDKANAIYKQVAKSKPFYRFWHNKAEKEMINAANNLIKEADQLKQKNKDIQRKIFFYNNEAWEKIKEFLIQNGFVLKDVTFIELEDLIFMECDVGTGCVRKTKVWILEEE